MIFNKRFGRYTLVKKLAMGGMAEVYLAMKRGPDRFEKLVALKKLHPHLHDDQAHVDMFYREARVGGVLDHPNLIRVFDADVIESRHTMVMEFVAGQTLDAIAARVRDRGENFSVPMALAIVSDAANGLHHAHVARDLDGTAMQLVHRDISPQNLLVGYDGTVKVFDFGVAVAASAVSNGQLAGKTAYMSPEQCRGKNIDARSDVFALGIVLHELLTGQPLFKRENHIKSIRAITEDDIPAPSTLREGIDEAVDAIVMKALARDIEDRFASAWELHLALADYLARHDLVVHERELVAWVEGMFRAEREEIDAVVQKILLAPERSDATIDLSTFDVKAAAAQGDVGIQTKLEGPAGDSPLAAAAAINLRPASGALDAVANAALADQLKRARRNTVMFAVLAIVGLALAAAAFLRPPPPPATITSGPAPAAESTVVRIESDPPGAAIAIDGAAHPDPTPTSVTLPTGAAASITLTALGYAADTFTLVPNPTDPTTTRVSRTLEVDPTSEHAPIGSVRVVFSPADAEVYVDGNLAGSGSPVVVERLPLNRELQLRLSREGYETLHFPLTLDNADILEIQLDLAEAVELGVLNINSRPPRADVFINNERVGETPLAGLELPANQTYTVQIRRAGSPAWRRAIVLRAGATENLVADFGGGEAAAPAAAAPAGGSPSAAPPAAEPEPPPAPEPPPPPRYQLIE